MTSRCRPACAVRASWTGSAGARRAHARRRRSSSRRSRRRATRAQRPAARTMGRDLDEDRALLRAPRSPAAARSRSWHEASARMSVRAARLRDGLAGRIVDGARRALPPRRRRGGRRARSSRHPGAVAIVAVRRRARLAGAPAARGGRRAGAAGDPRRQARRRGRGRRCRPPQRELAEEIGKAAAQLGAIVELSTRAPASPTSGSTSSRATDLRDGRAPTADENERIEIVPWPLERLDEAIAECQRREVADRAAVAGPRAERAR